MQNKPDVFAFWRDVSYILNSFEKWSVCLQNLNEKGVTMSAKATKLKLRELKKQMKAAKNERDLLLLKLFVLLVFVAVIAAVANGKIHLPMQYFHF